MLFKKLLRNFVTHGKITTTEAKAKALRPHIERLVHSAKKNTEATRILLKKRITDLDLENLLIQEVGPIFKEKQSGFTTLTHLPARAADGATIARLQWSLPVVYEKKQTKSQPKSPIEKTEKKPTKKAVRKTKK